MLSARCARTAALFMLALCTIASWYLALPFLPHGSYALITEPVENLHRQVRGLDAIEYSESPDIVNEVSPKSIFGGEYFYSKAHITPDKITYIEPGALSAKTLRIIASNSYHIVMNLPEYTANALIVHTIKHLSDRDSIQKLARSRALSVELYPEIDKGHSRSDGHCLVEFSVPFMGNDNGIAIMVCLEPSDPKGNQTHTKFIAKEVIANVPPNRINPDTRSFSVEVAIPNWNNKDPETPCTKYDYQNTYNILFNEIDDYVYKKLGSKRLIYMSDDTCFIKKSTRDDFLSRYYDYAMPKKCLKDANLREAIKKSHGTYNAYKKGIENRRVERCPSNMRKPSYDVPLLTEKELVALRSFNIIDNTGLKRIMKVDELNIKLSGCECMFEELAHNDDLSAEYKLSGGHHVRIEYFKESHEEGFVPGKLLYILIDAFGSVDAILFEGRVPNFAKTYEFDNYIRATVYNSQPYPSTITHIIRSKYFVNEKQDPPVKGIFGMYLSGYMMVCREKDDKAKKKNMDNDAFVDLIYNNIYSSTKLDFYLGKRGGNNKFFKHVDSAKSRDRVKSDYPKISESRKRFLKEAVLSIDCSNHSKKVDAEHFAPIVYDEECYKRNTHFPY